MKTIFLSVFLFCFISIEGQMQPYKIRTGKNTWLVNENSLGCGKIVIGSPNKNPTILDSSKYYPSETKKLIDSLRQKLKECEESTLIGEGQIRAGTIPSINRTFLTIEGFLNLYDQYKKECYEDSTLEHTHNPNRHDNCIKRTGNLAVGYSYTIDCKDSSHYSYTHRIPTFEDFTTWLRKQSNK